MPAMQIGDGMTTLMAIFAMVVLVLIGVGLAVFFRNEKEIKNEMGKHNPQGAVPDSAKDARKQAI